MNEFFNMNSISKNNIEREKRIQRQRIQYLKETAEREKQEAEKKEEKTLLENMKQSRLANATTISRAKQRVNSLEEHFNYTNKSVLIAISEMLSEVVEKALLLDEAEFSQLNPNYKDEIRETIGNLLESDNLNETIRNRDTLALIEYATKTLPDVKVGKYLTEADLRKIIEKQKDFNIDEAIKNLAGDVSSKVAALVENEQKDIAKSKEKLKSAGVYDDEAPEEEISDEEEVVEEEPADEGVEETDEADVSEEEDDSEEEKGYGRAIRIEPDGTTSISMPNGDISLNSDGSMDIQLTEGQKVSYTLKKNSEVEEAPKKANKKNVLVREDLHSGLLESLAVNKAKNLLSEGKPYNSDLCLADALMYITITETLNVSGIMTITESDYANIISALSGNRLKEESTQSINESFATKWGCTLNKVETTDLAERIRQKALLKENNQMNLNE